VFVESLPDLRFKIEQGMKLQDATSSLYQATVNRASLHLGDWSIDLPFIRGKGSFQVKYVGDALRIVENPGIALAVQVREELLQPKLGPGQG
jgi:hypothetical protein